MSEINQFGSAQRGSAQECSQCEALLMDVLDGEAAAEDQAFFDAHVVSCVQCSQMLADARRGQVWLEMLHNPRPEPPAALLDKILLQTNGSFALNETAGTGFGVLQMALQGPPALSGGEGYMAAALPRESQQSSVRKTVLPFHVRQRSGGATHWLGQTMLQPRLAMTAAMAFFSIALTLNLTGVRVSDLRASDLRPSTLRKDFYEANAHLVRYCDNLRVVYELEARTHDLQRGSDGDDAETPSGTRDNRRPGSSSGDPGSGTGRSTEQREQPKPKVGSKPGPGTSRREPATRDGGVFSAMTLLGIAEPMIPTNLLAAPNMKGDPA